MNQNNTTLLYGHRTCPDVPPIKGMLKLSKVPFVYIDIRQDESAAERVRQINNGFESVPTLIFPDGTTLTEPSISTLRAKLSAMGYRVGVLAWLVGNGKLILFGGIVVWALLRFLEVL
jgi:mycoredoxin